MQGCRRLLHHEIVLLIFQAMEEGAPPANADVGEVGGTHVEDRANAVFDYAERQRARWDQYHNATEAARKRKGPFQKDVRKDHDKLQTKVSDHIKLVVQMLH